MAVILGLGQRPRRPRPDDPLFGIVSRSGESLGLDEGVGKDNGTDGGKCTSPTPAVAGRRSPFPPTSVLAVAREKLAGVIAALAVWGRCTPTAAVCAATGVGGAL